MLVFFLSGLNNSLKYLEEKGLSLHNYHYSKPFLDAIMAGVTNVSFDGVSVIFKVLFWKQTFLSFLECWRGRDDLRIAVNYMLGNGKILCCCKNTTSQKGFCTRAEVFIFYFESSLITIARKHKEVFWWYLYDFVVFLGSGCFWWERKSTWAYLHPTKLSWVRRHLLMFFFLIWNHYFIQFVLNLWQFFAVILI